MRKERYSQVLTLALVVCVAVMAAPAFAQEKNDVSIATIGHDPGATGDSIERQAYYTATVDATGATFPWIDATVGTELVGAEGDDVIGALTFPFPIQVYDDLYADPDVIDVNSNGTIHTDQGGPRTLWPNCGEIPSTIDGQFVAPLADDLISSSIWYLVTGTAPNRVLTIEWVGSSEYSGGGLANLEVSFYEATNNIVVQVQIVEPFAFVYDGLTGINLGDAATGTEIACGSSGGLPSADFDVEFVHVVPVELQSFSAE